MLSRLQFLGGFLLLLPVASATYLSGVVTDPANKVLKGVVVKLPRLGSDTTTDSGMFRIEVPDSMIGERVNLLLIKDGYAPAPTQPLSFIVPKNDFIKLTMVPSQSFGTSAKRNQPIVEFSVVSETPGDDFSVAYSANRASGLLTINPVLPYLDLFRRGGPITLHSYAHTPFKMSLPQIDVKITNNTSDSVLFSEAVFRIDRSAVDPSPLLLIKG